MARVSLQIDIDISGVTKLTRNYPLRVERALNGLVDDLLDTAELIQIHAYTSHTFPKQPPGSDYQRTFKLRGASRKRRTGTRLPNIGGVWYTEGVDYDVYVLGPRRKQARIHRGRWKSLEQVRAELQEMAQPLAEERIKEINP